MAADDRAPLDDHEAHLHAKLRDDVRSELVGRDSFIPVLVLMLGLLGLIILGPANGFTRAATAVLAVVVVLLTVQRARVKRSTRTWMDVIIVAFGSLAFAEVVVSTTTDTPTVVTFIGKTLLAFVVLMSVPAVLRRVLVSHRIDLNVLAGALVAYLLIGLFFALLYGAVSTVVDPFFAQLDDPAIADDTYFSFITIATVGYGDLSPAPGVPRSLAVLEAVIGQVFLVTIVARVVSNLGSERELPKIAELDGDDDAAVTPDDDDRPPAQA